jgi:hypothetical protein
MERDDHEDRHATESFDVLPESWALGHSLNDTRNRPAKLPPSGPKNRDAGTSDEASSATLFALDPTYQA